jgi:hypothetical protein
MQQSYVDDLVTNLVGQLTDSVRPVDATAIAGTIRACATAGYNVPEQQLQLLVHALAGVAMRTSGR